MTENKDDPVEATLDRLKPVLAKLSFGTVMGYCSGYAFKKAGRALALAIGTVFIGLQAAASLGYLQVDWGKIQLDLTKSVDTTGDGKFDTDDLKEYWRRVKTVLKDRLPGAGGFSFGFLYGIKSG